MKDKKESKRNEIMSSLLSAMQALQFLQLSQISMHFVILPVTYASEFHEHLSEQVTVCLWTVVTTFC